MGSGDERIDGLDGAVPPRPGVPASPPMASTAIEPLGVTTPPPVGLPPAPEPGPGPKRFRVLVGVVAVVVIGMAVGMAVLATRLSSVTDQRDEARAEVDELGAGLAARDDRITELQADLDDAVADAESSREELDDLVDEREDDREAAIDFLTTSFTLAGFDAAGAACVADYAFDQAGFPILRQLGEASVDPSSAAAFQATLIVERGGAECGVDDDLLSDDILAGRDYGDNELLDELWDACEAGDLGSCDDLYFQSEILSEYERFGATCGGRSEPDATFISCRFRV